MKTLLCCLLGFCLMLPAQALEPARVVVVYNADSPLSTRSAQRYAQLRNIPAGNLVALKGVKGGNISRMDFEEKVRQPLMEVARQRDWVWPSSRTRRVARRMVAMVLMPDLPLGVAPLPRAKDAPPVPKLQENNASVDSELMSLGANLPVASAVVNPCYNKDFNLGRELVPVMAVCRIDGPDEASISRMLEDPPRVERTGLRGWTVIDHRGNMKDEGDGDGWLARIARLAKTDGQPLFYETSPATLATSFPLMTDTAVYFGWYAHPANGPFNPKAGGNFRFAPGAVAVHIHSNSASSVKTPTYWVAALLQRGAAVTAGNVYEPYLGPSLHLDVFYDRLLKGRCVAEAMLMATPVLSWQGVVMGDPLYRPYASSTRHAQDDVYAQWRNLRLSEHDNLKSMRSTVLVRLSQPHGAALAEMFAWHCAELGEWRYAIEFFTAACGRYTELRDRTRALIMTATALAADGQKERAATELLRWIEAGQNSPYLPALKTSYETISGIKLNAAEAKK